MVFRKVCNEDMEPAGFAGWAVPRGTLALEVESDDRGSKICNGGKDQGHRNKPPQSLDVETWVEVSKKCMEERRRVLQGRENVWRNTVNSRLSWDLLAQLHRVGLNLLSVNPAHQRKGAGSLLMEWGCGQADTGGQDMFLLASPAGIRLYEKFGFRALSSIEVKGDKFTSMLRTPDGICKGT